VSGELGQWTSVYQDAEDAAIIHRITTWLRVRQLDCLRGTCRRYTAARFDGIDIDMFVVVDGHDGVKRVRGARCVHARGPRVPNWRLLSYCRHHQRVLPLWLHRVLVL
jgi:hypothetical protein